LSNREFLVVPGSCSRSYNHAYIKSSRDGYRGTFVSIVGKAG
jgi:hypothetical protein